MEQLYKDSFYLPVMFLKLLFLILFTTLIRNSLCEHIIIMNDDVNEKPTIVEHVDIRIKEDRDYRRFGSRSRDDICDHAPYDEQFHECLPKLKHMNTSAYDECGLNTPLDEDSGDCEVYQCLYANMTSALHPGPYRRQLNNFTKENPVVREAMNILVTNCTDAGLGYQGVRKNCSAYDVHLCIKKLMFQVIPDNMWGEGCSKVREFLTKCLACPMSCRDGHAEPGTCLACNF